MIDPALSWVQGGDKPALLEETIGQAFDRIVREHPARDALIVAHQSLRLSYADLANKVDATAGALIRIGLEPGDRLGLWAPNCAEWVVVQFAAAKAGVVLVNLNPAYRAPEVEYAMRKAGCKALITATTFKTSDYIDMLRPLVEFGRDGGARSDALPNLRWVIALGDTAAGTSLAFDDWVASAAGDREGLAALATRLEPRDPINIQFTSGTTGSPKGATLSHHGIVNNALMIGEPMRMAADDRMCIQVPLYHAFGMIMATMTCLVRGATMVLPSDSFDPVATLRAIAKEGCTVLHGVPTMFTSILDHPEFARSDVSSLRTGIMAGAPCPAELMKRVLRDLHMPEITIGYGMTETSALGFQTRPDDAIERRVSTVGTVHPHVEAKIVDEKGETVGRGQPGEILTRGYGTMLGYWEDPEKTAETIDDEGWLHSGDLGTLDADGYCDIVGRIKDMVIRGGENLFPREIEDILHQHPEVRDVQVFGVADRKYGEELCAWIVADAGSIGEDEIRSFCRDRIAHFKIPRYIRFVDEFPMTVTGKARKFVMRRQMEDELAGP